MLKIMSKMTYLLLSFVTITTAQPDVNLPQFEWQESTLEEVGLPVDSFANLEIDWATQFGTVTGLVVVYQDAIIYELYDGQTSDSLMPIFSVTKCIGSILTGIAIDAGDIESVDEPISTFFPSYFVDVTDEDTASITVENILTMSTGLLSGWNLEGSPINAYRGDLFIRALNAVQTDPPNSISRYNTIVSNLMSGILSEAITEDLEDYAAKVLFEPLGITDWRWYRDDNDFPTLGAGLELRTRDMARIGRLMLHDGDWEGQQIVSQEWVQQSTQSHFEIDVWTGETEGYAYLWWVSQDIAYDNFLALGYGGQFIYVVPELDLVVAISSRCCADPTVGWNARKIVDDYIIHILESVNDR
ncbi:MAG: serine hydrolase [Phototrophicaceae bacterium]